MKKVSQNLFSVMNTKWSAGGFFTNCMAVFNPIKMNVVGEHFSWERGWGSFTCNIVLKLSRAQVGVNLVILNRGRFIKNFAIWPNWNEIIRGKNKSSLKLGNKAKIHAREKKLTKQNWLTDFECHKVNHPDYCPGKIGQIGTKFLTQLPKLLEKTG